jgi:hypothetical protein
MKASEAAELIDAIARSIQENPSQFHFEINVIGTQATAIGGGTGLSVQARGGGPGSTTIGYQSTISGANVEIAQKAANGAIRQGMSALVQTLNNLASELHSASPDEGHINKIWASLKQSWIPNVITSVIGSIVAKIAFG